jgi:trimethylamine:corrinoid methyltransferase-like protein
MISETSAPGSRAVRFPTFGFWRLVFLVLAGAGTAAVVLRFAWGLGATTNLRDEFPWGLWIGFDVLCSVLGFPDGLGLGLYPFDFRYGAIVFGSAEWCLYHALSLQMTEHLTGRPVRHGGFRSTGKRPDPQATLERAASALWQALLGVRHFGAVGQLSTDEVFSPQQAVLDREILGYVERVVRGIDLGPPEVDPVELIGAGVREGSFLGVMDTVTRFRDFYHFPDIFRHWTVRGWRTAGQPSILTEAWTRAQEEITSSRFHLADGQARAVKNLSAKACAYLQGRPSTAREEARK